MLFYSLTTLTATGLDENLNRDEFNALSLWLAANKLVVNVDKTIQLNFKTIASNYISSFRINDFVLSNNVM